MLKKIAIVTGIAIKSGIGRNIVLSFLREGYYVGGIDNIDLEFNNNNNNNESNCEKEEDNNDDELIQSIQNNKFIFNKANISSEIEISNAIQNIFQKFECNQVYALINNAGISSPYLTETTTENRINQWKNYINVNLTGAFIVTELVFPYLVQGSSIIHISSTRAHQSEPFCEGYAASKAGLLGLTHSQAVSFASNRIRVNCILPGWIDTKNYPVSDGDKQWHCVGRVGIPSDISELALFLCDSNRSGFITGQEFIVDGGVSKKMVYP